MANPFFKKRKPAGGHTPADVGAFYDATTDRFLQVYGEIIQAFRTKDVTHYLDYTLRSMRLEPGMRVVDAGCGVCGPAQYFARQLPGLTVDACTVSEVQARMARESIENAGLSDRIRVTVGDYHGVNTLYPAGMYDRVYFLESFGHSDDKKKLIHAVWDVLKPGGMLYLKDLFRREVEQEWEQLRIDHICGQINEAYRYHIADLADVLSIIRRKGYILHFVKIPEVERSQFENLSISNDFQNLFNIGKIESWDDYVFPVDFFEILAEKPVIPTAEDMHLYFMNKK